ncbi:MAG: FGGY family carbohydrate kinase [Planctomycetota bacterium]
MARDSCVLAIDQGGHASRAALFDLEGNLLTLAVAEVRVERYAPDTSATGERVEHDADELLASVRAVIETVAAAPERGGRPIVAAGIATQRSTCLGWERATGAPLTPVISWQDRRAARFVDGLAARAEWIARRTGLRLSPHYGASKLRWCLDHLPAVRAARDRRSLAFGPIASYLVQGLSTERVFAVDPANAQRTLLWDLRRGDWDPELIAVFGVDGVEFPRCCPTLADFGTLEPRTGERVPIRALNGDQSAALFAVGGALRDDVAYLNIGTGAFLQRPFDETYRAPVGLLRGVVSSDGKTRVCVLEGAINGAGSALAVEAAALGVAEPTAELEGWLAQETAPPLYLNGVSGLGSPYWRADFASAFVGAGGGAARLVAVIESVAFLIQVNLELVRGVPPPLVRIDVSGGLARLDGLCQRLADLSIRPVVRRREIEATARGIAYLAAGQPATWREPPTDRVFQPTPNPALRARFDRWRAELTRRLK